MMTRSIHKLLTALALAGVVSVSGACDWTDTLLEVQNPQQIPEADVNNPELIEVLVNSVIGTFNSAYDDPYIWRGSMFTDMQITGINWEQTARLSQRIVRYDEGDADFMFSAISSARAMADSVAGRFETLLPEVDANPSSDARMALAKIYHGYTLILLADAMCEATINVGDKIYQPLEIYQLAADEFQSGLSVATAAGDTDLVYLAHVGLGRANLNLGNYAAVKQYVAPGLIPTDWYYWAEYDKAADGNTLFYRTRASTGNHALGMHPNFMDGPFGTDIPDSSITDPRVQYTGYVDTGHNALTLLYEPYMGRRFQGYNGQSVAEGGQPAIFEESGNIAMADGIEALHHYWEAVDAEGSNPAGVLAFVNERRAAGHMDPVNLSGNDLTMELRNQRGRDLFLGGLRLGDLRRWDRGGDDMFPSGTHPTTEWGQYGDAKCYPLPLEEYQGNPNLPVP
jgi:hypothetical protein